jgi:hypothetical protein
MTDPVGPVDRVQRPRRVGRRLGVGAAGRTSGDSHARFLVPAGPPHEELPPAPGVAAAGYAAQVLGEGEKRGLRGGAETLDRARTTYLETEWSGPADRRHARGRITKTEI